MIANRGLADSQLHKDAAFQLTAADPVAAAKALARGLRQQTRGAKLIAFRQLAAAIADHEPGILVEMAGEIARLTKQGED